MQQKQEFILFIAIITLLGYSLLQIWMVTDPEFAQPIEPSYTGLRNSFFALLFSMGLVTLLAIKKARKAKVL